MGLALAAPAAASTQPLIALGLAAVCTLSNLARIFLGFRV